MFGSPRATTNPKQTIDKEQCRITYTTKTKNTHESWNDQRSQEMDEQRKIHKRHLQIDWELILNLLAKAVLILQSSRMSTNVKSANHS